MLDSPWRACRAPGTADAGVGRPLAGIEVRVQGDEVQVRGPVLFSGYWGAHEPQAPEAWFRTGDTGYFDEGGPSARIEAVIDGTAGTPRLLFWRDISHLGRGYPLETLGVGASENVE